MTDSARAALAELTEHPAEVGRWCGFKLLRDDLHGEWLDRIINGRGDMTLMAHRGSYKTTCLTIALAVMMICHPWQTIIFLRKADDDVVEVIKQTASILRGPVMRHLTAEIYGRPVDIVRANATEITTSAYASPRGSAQLLGIGTGGSITGKHADIVITDDIVNVKDRASRAERDRIRSIYMELQNIRNPGGRIINTGTPWHKDDAFAIMPEPIKYDCYQTGLLSADQLETLRHSMSPSLFAANYELRHIASEDALFATPPRFQPDAALLRDGIAHIDAAYGGEDFTALTCGKLVGDRLVLYGRLWQQHVDSVMDEIIAACDRLMCGPILCETNGDKGYVARELRARGAMVRPYAETMNKHVKIATLLRKHWPHVLFVQGTDRTYIDQILDYTAASAHDDAPDSAACLIRALERNAR